MRITRIAGRVAASAAIATGLILPASATSAQAAVGGGVATFNVCGGTHCVVGTLNTRIYPTGLGSDVVEFECTVTASGAAVSTTLSTCTVGGRSALLVPLSAPGPAVASVGAAIFPAGTYVEVCVGGSAVWAESLLGPITVSGSDCGTALVLAT